LKKYSRQNIAVAAIVGCFVIVIGGYNLLKLYTFNFTHAAQDQAIFLQVVYSFVHHFNFSETIYHSGNFLGDQHFTPAFAFLGTLAPIIPNKLLIAFFPIFVLVICALVAYSAAKDKIGGTWPPVLVLGLCLFNPAAFYFAGSGIRETILAALTLAGALHFFRKQHFIWFCICCLAACLCKEDVPLIVAGFALPALVGKRSLRWLIFPPLFGVGAFVIIRLVLMPALATDHSQIGVGFQHFSGMGEGIGNIAAFILTHPLQTVAHLFDAHNLEFIRQLIGSFWFLPLLAPELLLVPLTQFLEIGLSASKHTADLRNWYYAPIYPFLAMSLVYGFSRLSAIGDRLIAQFYSPDNSSTRENNLSGKIFWHRFHLIITRETAGSSPSRAILTTVLTLLLIFSIAVPVVWQATKPYSFQGVFVNTNPPSINEQTAHYLHYLNYFRFFAGYYGEIADELKMIDDNASVCAQYPFLIHFAWREKLTQFPDVDGADYIVLHRWLERYPLADDPEKYYTAIAQLIDNGYHTLIDKNGLIVLTNRSGNVTPDLPKCGQGCREYEAEYLPVGIVGDPQQLHLYDDSNRIDKSSSAMAGRRATLRHDYVIRNWRPQISGGKTQIIFRIKFNKLYPGSEYLLRAEALDRRGIRQAEMLILENDVIFDDEYRQFSWNLPDNIGETDISINLVDTHRASYLIDTVQIISYPTTATAVAIP
jgi:uncharacterized membrane protein